MSPKLPAGHGDGRRLTQVLINLVGNAIKFTDAGEVVITGTASDGSFHLSVRDTGPGISAADQAKLFQEFQQADNAITRKKGGTGLGSQYRNASSRSRRQNLGGVTGRSWLDVLLHDPCSRRTAGTDGMSKRILVVEDQEDNRQIIRDMLSATDYEIMEAESGEAALSLSSETAAHRARVRKAVTRQRTEQYCLVARASPLRALAGRGANGTLRGGVTGAQIERPPRSGHFVFPFICLFRRPLAPCASCASRTDPSRQGRWRRAGAPLAKGWQWRKIPSATRLRTRLVWPHQRRR